MVSDSEDGVVFLGLRKFCDEVQGDDLKRICLWLREYRYQRSLGGSGVDLVMLTFRTSSDILYHILLKSWPPVLPLDQVGSPTNSWVSMHR